MELPAGEIADIGYNYFLKQKHGHIVGISSVAGVRGIEILPGFVNKQMAKGEGIFWMASVKKASQQMAKGIEKRNPVVYVTRRWRIVAYLIRVLPKKIYDQI